MFCVPSVMQSMKPAVRDRLEQGLEEMNLKSS